MIETERLLLRPTVASDRSTFVKLFQSEDFMVFSGGALTERQAHQRFDTMVQRSGELAFAKQPVVERKTGNTLGYAGVNRFVLEDVERLEFGWRLIPSARGKGYATEAAQALLRLAAKTYWGEIIAMVDPTNAPSIRVAEKVGFTFWKRAEIDDAPANVYRYQVGA